MAPHSSTLVWKIPWMEEPGGLQSMGSLRVGHDWATSLSLFTFMHWRRKWQPTPVFLPGEPQDWGAWWAAIYGVTQSWTLLKWLSSSSSSSLCFGPLRWPVFAGSLCLDVPSSEVSILCITWVLETNEESQASPRLLNQISHVNQIPWWFLSTLSLRSSVLVGKAFQYCLRLP